MCTRTVLGAVLFGLYKALTQASHVGDSDTPVRKVVTLLEDMKAQIEKEANADTDVYDKYACWCQTNKAEKTEAVATAQVRIADLEAIIEKSVAIVAQMKTEIAEHEKGMAEDQQSLATATSAREKDMKAFYASVADLKEVVTGLTKALEVLSKVQLMQTKGHGISSPKMRVLLLQAHEDIKGIHSKLGKFRGVMQRDLWDMLGSLDLSAGSIGASSAFLGHRDALTQENLLPWEKTEEQLGKEANPNDLTGAAAGAKSYNSRSGEIYGMLETMLTDFKKSIEEEEAEEAAAQKTFEELRKAKMGEIELAAKQKTAKEERLADATSKETQSKKDIEATKKSLSADEQFLVTLEKDCKTADTEYEARGQSRTDELVVLEETIQALSTDDARDLFGKVLPPSFLQTVNKHHSAGQTVNTEEEVARSKQVNQVMKMLLLSARQHRDWSLASLAVRVKLDDFTKVKAMIDKLIEELKAQQKAEVEKKDFCTQEIGDTELQIQSGTREKEDLEALKVKLAGEHSTLAESIETLKSQVAEMEVSLTHAGDDRAAENKIFQEAVSDQRATILLLKKAEDMLKNFYMKAALMQKVDPPPPMGTSYEKSSAAGGVIQMLNKIIKDAELAEKSLIADEMSAQKSYEELVKELNTSMEVAKASVVEKSNVMEITAGKQAEADGAALAKGEEISKLEEQLSGVHGDCDYVLKFFDIRQTARVQEIESLAEAKAILSGANFGDNAMFSA